MSTQFTPGPWAVRPARCSSFLEIHSAGRKVAECEADILDDVDVEDTQAENAANARLLAAAPDLLTACREMLKSIEAACAAPIGPEGWKLVESYFLADAARAAIAKATGEAL